MHLQLVNGTVVGSVCGKWFTTTNREFGLVVNTNESFNLVIYCCKYFFDGWLGENDGACMKYANVS